MIRSSHSQMFYKLGALKNFARFTGKYLRWSHFFIKFHKKWLKHRSFPWSLAKFLKTSFIQNISGRLLFDRCFWKIMADVFEKSWRSPWKNIFWKLKKILRNTSSEKKFYFKRSSFPLLFQHFFPNRFLETPQENYLPVVRKS